jgi:endonuclease
MRADYKTWLEDQKYEPGTITAQLHRVGRIEDHYGSLDEHFKNEGLQSLIDQLSYSMADERAGKPNPSKIPFKGDARKNLASYKDAVIRYRKFLTGGWERADADAPLAATIEQPNKFNVDVSDEPARQKLSLERDMQAALRRNIKSLGISLTIIDDGAERSVDSGFIDITCEDSNDGSIVIVELKADKADSRAIGQVLGYMGDVSEQEGERKVRGILVAHDFDKRAKSAAKAVPSLTLMRYSVAFQFETER